MMNENQEAIDQRTEQIRELEGLWKQLSGLRGEKGTMAEFDYEINRRMQTTSGRDSLSFESIRSVKLRLDSAINRANGVEQR